MALIDGLISYWKFDENTGTQIIDVTNNGYDFNTMSSGDSFSSEFEWVSSGKINSSLKRKSTGSDLNYIYANNFNETVQPGDDFTYNVWIKGNISTVSHPIYISLWSNIYALYFGIREPNNSGANKARVYFLSYTNTSAVNVRIYSNDATITDGNWHMITVTRKKSSNKSDLKAYLDGVDITVSDTSQLINNNYTVGGRAGNITLGGGNQGTQQLFNNGEYDEYGIWNRALTQAEVSELYNSGAGLTYPFIPTQHNFFSMSLGAEF